MLGPKFLHVYLNMSIDILEKIVPEADQNGYRAIVVTCDDPTNRVWDNMSPLFLEASKYIDPEVFETINMPNMNLIDVDIKLNFYTISMTWRNVESLRKLTKLPIICKGILSPIDAELAIKYGANGIIVRFVSAKQIIG